VYIGWDEKILRSAKDAALDSKDSTKVGAVLVSDYNGKLLTAFNGPPIGVKDTPERFIRPTKYYFASHAEQNLIAFAARHGIKTDGMSVVVTHFPCSSCAKSLIQAGIQCVVVGNGTTSMPDEEFEHAKQMFSEAGVTIRKYD